MHFSNHTTVLWGARVHIQPGLLFAWLVCYTCLLAQKITLHPFQAISRPRGKQHVCGTKYASAWLVHVITFAVRFKKRPSSLHFSIMDGHWSDQTW